ncbi:hypothetical protein PtB15_18B98 [Puccinia triticina]|nr:hypothetical protein PtB15_18B98 [Puccinia triticina]
MQELDSLHDLLVFSHSPLPESHPAGGIDTRPPPGSHDLSDILNVANIPWPESHPDPRSTITIDNVHPLPESGYLHNNNILDLANRPQLESRPIFTATETHPTRVQKKRPSGKNQIGNSARKKKKASSDETSDLAFEIINSEWSIENERQVGTIDNMHPLPVSGRLPNNNILDFTNTPLLEFSPILTSTNMHPTSVRKLRQKRQKKLKPLPRKNKKPSSDDTAPAFEIINSMRPVESEIRVIFEAIRSLKKVNGDRFIGSEQEGEYKMLKIEEDQVFKRNADVYNQIRKVRSPGTAHIDFDKQHKARRWGAVKRFMDEANSSNLELWSLYTDRVVPQFVHLKIQLQEKIRKNHSGPSEQSLLDDLEHTLKILPVYLFYVDIINTLIPAQVAGTEDVATLQSQRQAAGRHFFEYLRELIEHPYPPDS